MYDVLIVGGGLGGESLGKAMAEQWDCMILTQWDRPADDERSIRRTRELYAQMEPHFGGAVYVNDLGGDEGDRVRAAYGANYDRLAAIKAQYDPGNFFRWNLNVTTATI